MAISINWGTSVINVPKADLTLIQLTPIEIREMNLNWFRLELKDLEDTENGMMFPNTHIHNTEVSLGGLTYARVIEILDPYTITFEDGQYAVNLVGANSNVGDKVNVNQVSVRSANSAGLTSSPAIEFASFNGGVTVDTGSSYSGTTYPVGTPQQPVNNLTDALLIAEYRGFGRFYIMESMEIDNSLDFAEIEFIGQSVTKTLLTINPNANVTKCEFYETAITGTLDGQNKLKNCLLQTLNFVNGVVEQCLLGAYTVTLGGGTDAYFLDCWSAVAGTGTPIINMGGSGQKLGLRNYNGGLKITNMTGANDNISLDLNSGRVVIDSSTVTAGTIVCRGIGTLIDENGVDIPSGTWNGGVTIVNTVLDSGSVSRSVQNEIGTEIQYAAFNGGVWIDVDNGTAGITYPIGTPGSPVNNLADAKTIAESRGFNIIFLMSNLTITTGQNVDDYLIKADSWLELTVESGASCVNTQFEKLSLYGEMCGTWNVLIDCWAYDITNFMGWMRGGSYSYIELAPYTIPDPMTYGSSYFDDIVPMYTYTPCVLVMNTNTNPSFTNSTEVHEIRNMTAGSILHVGLAHGKVIIDSSCTGGDIYVIGIGTLTNNSAMTTIDTSGLINEQTEYLGSVHIDTVNGVAGSDYGKGTIDNPVNNLADALIILERENFISLIIHGSLTISENLSGLHLHGIQHIVDYNAGDSINLNGKVFTDVGFGYICLEGSMSVSSTQLQYHNCYLKNVLNLSGSAEKCSMTGDNSILAGDYFSSVGMIFEGDYTTIDLQSTTGTTASLDIDSGYVEFLNSVTGCLIEVNMRGGEIELNASCTGGDFYAEGYGTLYGDPVALGMTVKANHLLALETIEDQVLDAQTTDHEVVGSIGEAITDAGIGGNPWAAVVEGTHTANDIMRYLLSFVSGEATGAGTATVTFKSDDGLVNRIVMTVDTKGNRSAVVLDGSD